MSPLEDRRGFLKRAGVGVAGVLGAGALVPLGAAGGAGGARASDTSQPSLETDGPPLVSSVADPDATLAPVAFHGPHQAGILTPPPPAATFVSFDVVAENRGELIELLRTLTETARSLTTGGTPPGLGVDAPPSDSGTLGPMIPADGLTVTVGFGATLFDERFGIAAHKPVHLKPMVSFPNDNLDPALTGGDVLLQLCGGSPDTVIHAIRQIASATSGGMQINWRQDGFHSPPRPAGTPRNHFAFKDGIVNPDVQDEGVADQLLWVTNGIGEPGWAVGGSYHVVRIIQQFIEFWDRVSLTEQQQMIGRFRDSGAPLDGTAETDIPDYQADPTGAIVPLTAHIRLANPRSEQTADSRIYRRGYNYDNGVDLNGNLDMGLVFNCFQQDIARQFEANQRRLIDEPMVDYISPIGGGYFFVLPGVRDEQDWYASGLLT
jgi:deferrochelatase/peroxidase EfeB